MKFERLTRLLPTGRSSLLALLSAILLILAFPDFEYWLLAWFALVPLLWAVEREKASFVRSFFTGWLFGTVFFFGTCWWLTYAPITYARFPPWLAYSGMVFVAVIVGVFPAIFAGVQSLLLRRFGTLAFLAAPFVWVFTEFLRYWLTGNNWNAVGYSQALDGIGLRYASLGGIYTVSFVISAFQSLGIYLVRTNRADSGGRLLGVDSQPPALARWRLRLLYVGIWIGFVSFVVILDVFKPRDASVPHGISAGSTLIIAIQPNVPMAGLTSEKWRSLRVRHEILGESAVRSNLTKFEADAAGPQSNDEDREIYSQIVQKRIDSFPKIVIFPESPMNFAYEEDRETKEFINSFAMKNNVSVLFNSAEPDKTNGKYFNSAVMVSSEGRKVSEYDKIYLLPFGEAVPSMLEGIVPGFVGNFSYGREYDLLPVGDAKAGVMICFESHFGQLSRRYVQDGADVIIEMTNDGYLGPTPVLRQHLANAVFRAVETNRPVLRVTNVGITAYINEKGEVLDATLPYQEDTRIWSVSKSDGSQTFYVKYGDWFAWLCSMVTIGLFGYAVFRRKQ